MVAFVLRGDRSGAEIRGHVERLGAVRLVVGLPVGMSGREGPQAEDVRAFVASIADQVGLPIEYWDERLTTSIAEKSLIAGGRGATSASSGRCGGGGGDFAGYLDSQRWRR